VQNQNRLIPAWLSLIAWLLLIAGFALFFTGESLIRHSKLVSDWWNIGHILYFGLLTFLLNRWFPLTSLRAGLLLTGCVLVVGILIEYYQARIGRDASWQDVLNNLAGVWICLVWLQPDSGRIRLARIAVLALALPALSKMFLHGALQFHAAMVFPVLADFESALEIYEYNSNVKRTQAYSSHGKYGIQLTLTEGGYTGISFHRTFADWSTYRTLRFDMYNPDVSSLDMVIRVNDLAHDDGGWKDDDRFNYHFRLQTGWNHLSIPVMTIRQGPEDRLMDMSRISAIILYTSQLPSVRTVYLDYLRLE
jgi:VanZ family protein